MADLVKKAVTPGEVQRVRITVNEESLWYFFLYFSLHPIQSRGHDCSSIVTLGNYFIGAGTVLQILQNLTSYGLCALITTDITKPEKALLDATVSGVTQGI